MSSSRASFDAAILSAWRGQLAATGKRLGMRTYLLQHSRELLPRFAAVYRQLRTLPRRLRKALQRRWGMSLAGVALLLTIQPLSSEAADFTASTAAELVTAITTANSTAETDTITLTADITLDTADNTTYGPTGLPVVSSALTIAGNGHAIRRELSDPDQFRLLAVNSGGNLTLQDTTLSGGLGRAGGAIFNRYGQLTLVGSTVSGNMAEAGGGGVEGRGVDGLGTTTIRNSTITGNTARYSGGGVSGGQFTITNSTISGNTASIAGGGVSGGQFTITNSTISGNTASGGDGGGVQEVCQAVDSTITNSTISGNTASGDGGGVFNSTITDSTISGNSAGGNGGGMLLVSIVGRTATLTNSTVSGNTAGGEGGGVVSGANNAYGGDRPPFYCFPAGRVTLSHNLLSGNSAPTIAEVYHYGGLLSAAFNLFGHRGLTTAQALSGVPTGGSNIMATSDGNKPTALADILDTTLQNNGGPTLTQNLIAGSPAIDAAPADANCPATDQRGAPRPFGPACDIGAVEFGSVPSALDCSTATASVDFPRLGNRHRYPVTMSGVTAPQGDEVSLTITSTQRRKYLRGYAIRGRPA